MAYVINDECIACLSICGLISIWLNIPPIEEAQAPKERLIVRIKVIRKVYNCFMAFCFLVSILMTKTIPKGCKITYHAFMTEKNTMENVAVETTNHQVLSVQSQCSIFSIKYIKPNFNIR